MPGLGVPRLGSDHHSLLIFYSIDVLGVYNLSEFRVCGFSRPSFLDFVRSTWSFSIPDSGSGVLVYRLKLLKTSFEEMKLGGLW